MDEIARVLEQLADCVQRGAWASVETERLEIKPVPATGHAWDSIRQTVCAFLNTNGGVIVLGVKDEKSKTERGQVRRYTFTPWTEHQTQNLADMRTAFRTVRQAALDVSEFLREEIRPFLNGHVAILRVSALPGHQKYCTYDGKAYRRFADADGEIPSAELNAQEERKKEMEHQLELQPLPGVGLETLSLERINQLILLINEGQSRPIETIKATLEDAAPFLERRRFVTRDGRVTILGALVCALHPEEHLLFRSQVDAFVDVPNVVAQDKKTFRDNILQLMESARAWTLRNIYTGVSHERSGTRVSEYPESLIRESINNALAHRDYAIERPVQVSVRPRELLSIRNPGKLPDDLVLEAPPGHRIPLLRIFANPRARNPRLADVLKLHDRWEGKGIGMSELVQFALANEIDVPYYVFHSADELSLCIPTGSVLDEGVQAWFELFDGFIDQRRGGRPLTHEHLVVLAYLLKSERLNRQGRHTLALTKSNNHFEVLDDLTRAGLVELHDRSERFKEAHVVCRELAEDGCFDELRSAFGTAVEQLDDLTIGVLEMIGLAQRHSKAGGLNAKQVSRLLGPRRPDELAKRGEEEFYRAIRYRVERRAPDKKSIDLTADRWHSSPEAMLEIHGPASRPLFRWNRKFQAGLFR